MDKILNALEPDWIGSSTAHLVATVTQSDHPTAKVSSKSSSSSTSKPKSSTARHAAVGTQLPRGSSRHRERSCPRYSNNNSRLRDEGDNSNERRSQHRGRDHHGHGSSSRSRRLTSVIQNKPRPSYSIHSNFIFLPTVSWTIYHLLDKTLPTP